MSVDELKKLTIENLRGSVTSFSLQFEKGKKLTVIFGENAAGKSTICDAFEFLGKGKIGSLENRGLGKTGRYWTSLGKKPTDVAVSLETANSSCRATLGKTEVVITPIAARPRVEVLRRSQILSLVQATPAERYTAISRFIDVSNVEASESTLRDLVASLKRDREIAVTRVRENRDTIQQFWEAAGKPADDPLVWAKAEAARDPNAFDTEISALDALCAAYDKLADYPARFKTADSSLAAAKAKAETSLQKTRDTAATIAADAGEVVALLESAKAYLHKHPTPATCPLCENPDSIADLQRRVSARLESFSELRSAQKLKSGADQEVTRISQQLETLKDGLQRHVAEFAQCRGNPELPKDIPFPKSAFPTDLAAVEPWLIASANLPREWKKVALIRADKKQFLNALQKALITCRDNTKAHKELDLLIPKMKKALEIVETERRTFTDGVLAAIASEVGRIYELVHPGEGLNKISLELDSTKRASLEMGASFCGASGTPPQAYFSESHLDTLGLCVFLAMAALDQPENTILVLDDVLASVDEPHVERLIEMLYSETQKFRHCIIATHYRPWKQKLRWGWLKNGQCQFVELSKWTSTGGMKLIRSIPDIARLKELLQENPPDPQLVCAKAGIILEAALDFLTLLYECEVPRKPDGNHTLGDLLPAVDRKLRQALKVDVLSKDAAGTPTYQTVALTSIFDELHRIAQARNVFGCHFNTISFDLLETDAIGFGQKVSELMEVLIDANSGWPRNPKSGSYWATAGETRRLHPLRRPV